MLPGSDDAGSEEIGPVLPESDDTGSFEEIGSVLPDSEVAGSDDICSVLCSVCGDEFESSSSKLSVPTDGLSVLAISVGGDVGSGGPEDVASDEESKSSVDAGSDDAGSEEGSSDEGSVDGRQASPMQDSVVASEVEDSVVS